MRARSLQGQVVRAHPVGCRKGYAEAREDAVADAVRILRDLTGITEGEAVLHCRTVGSLRNETEYFARPDRLPLVAGLEVPVPFLPGFLHM